MGRGGRNGRGEMRIQGGREKKEEGKRNLTL